MKDSDDTQRMVLLETLRLAVPMWMRELHGWPFEYLLITAARDSETVAAHGDDLQFGGKHCADAFHALARGLAIAAILAEGGVDFLGLHWCATPNCRAGSRTDHADDTAPDEWADESPPRPVETLPDIAAWTG